MSGHSHWAGIKHRKGINDAKRAKVFTKYARPILIAARDGGGNPDTNFRLKMAIDQARSVNMPRENIERAIKRGTGEIKDGTVIEEVTYEAYGPGQVAMLIKTATDKRNRTLGELKTLLADLNGKIVSEGSVAFMFKPVGQIGIEVPEGADPYALEMQAIEAGAEDTEYSESLLMVYTKPEELQKVKDVLEQGGAKIGNAGLGFVPLQKTTLTADDKLDYEKLLEALDDQEDVQEIFDNL